MKYPNAFAGVKKILISQYMIVISTVCMLFGAVIALAGIQGGNDALVIIGGGVTLAAAVVEIISLIMNLIGLGQARKDDKLFSYAFIFAILSLIAAALSSVLTSSSPKTADWLSFGTKIFEIVVIECSVSGIVSLADQLGNSKVSEFGSFLRKVITLLWSVVVVVECCSNLLTSSLSNIMDIVIAVLRLVVFILYIALLSRARKMLQAG